MVILYEDFQSDDLYPEIFTKRNEYRPLHDKKPKMHTQIANKCIKCGELFYTDTFAVDVCPDCAWEM